MYVTLAVVVVAIVVAVGWSSRVQKAATDVPITDSKLKVGDTAPAFAIATNAGNFDLAQVSTPVLLEVFATWCPHCQRETAVLNDVASKYAGKLAMVAVSGSPYGVDGSSPETQNDVNGFSEHFAVRYPVAFDARAQSRAAVPQERLSDARAHRQEQEDRVDDERRDPRDRHHEGDQERSLTATADAVTRRRARAPISPRRRAPDRA